MGGKRNSPPFFLAKKWDPLFAKDRKLKEVGPYVQWKREIEAVGGPLNLFFSGDLEDSGPASDFDDVKLFCEGGCLETLKSGAGAAGKRRGAILDDRSCTGSAGDRCEAHYNNPLSATELYEHLNKPVYEKNPPSIFLHIKFKADPGQNLSDLETPMALMLIGDECKNSTFSFLKFDSLLNFSTVTLKI
jgi:hypothetical protein